MNNKIKITEYFSDVELTKEYDGYYYSVGEALTIVILGSFCGLRNVNQIHQWATNERVMSFLKVHFGIEKIPCYFWLLCLLKIIKPKSFNRCFIAWIQDFVGVDKLKKLTLSFDGKTIRSTGKMVKYDKPLHVVSAQIGELGITLGQTTVSDKSNEIPAVRDLLEMLKIEGCIVVADAMHCQKETAKAIIKAGADYVLSVKDNQEKLKENIENRVQNDEFRMGMDMHSTEGKKSGRYEIRTAYSTCDIDWLDNKNEWENIVCVGAVNTQFTTKKGTSNEWHYFISSRCLSAKELLHHVRMEWSVETMHWFLDVHFGEDFCRVEDADIQQNLNMIRKVAINNIKTYKTNNNDKTPVSRILLGCLLEPAKILDILDVGEN